MSKDGEMRTYPQLPSQYQEPMVPEESPEWTAEVVKHFATPEQLAFFEEQVSGFRGEVQTIKTSGLS